MKFEEVLGEVLAETGLPVAGQSDGQGFSLLFDNEHEVEFEPDAEDGSVVFHAEVGDADRLGDAALRALFEASLLGANTDGAAFSIEPRFSKVVLWKRCHEFSSAAALHDTFLAARATVTPSAAPRSSSSSPAPSAYRRRSGTRS